MDSLLKALLGLGLTGIAMNVLLVATVLKIKQRHEDITLALLLAVADIFVATTTVTSSSLLLARSSTPLLADICRFVTFIDFVLLYAAMALVALISLVRRSRVVCKRIPTFFWVLLSIMSVLYFPAVMLSALRGEFQISPSGMDCPGQMSDSFLSLAVASLLGTSMLILLVTTIWGYLSIILHLSEPSEVCLVPKALHPIAGNHPIAISLPRATSLNIGVLVRIVGIVIVYLVLIVPPALMLLASTTKLVRLTTNVKLVFAIFASTLSIANPSLILFAHSTIYNQLISSFRPLPSTPT
ncbi:hypothetical protein DSO57_1004865 [Entomophthora muscae]|uniref:Uncharacterized protein n=1 Tax=Entomophthora muscae TaxID=34485 RepID=A0ACC2RZ73_9FUNG|nr:hypothetical protein DSO57_1004865 [Entomophthora muscae]